MTIAFNKKTIDSFNYQPVHFKNTLLGAVPLVLIIVGLIFDDGGGSFNPGMAVILGVVGTVLFYKYIKDKTDKDTSIKAISILLLYGSIMAIVGLIVMMIILASLSSDDDERREITWYHGEYWW